MGIRKVFCSIPPLKNIYKRIEELEERNAIFDNYEKQIKILKDRCTKLEQENIDLKKKYDYIFGVEQKYEKNMNMCYENLKKEVRDNKKTMDSRHEYVNKKVDGNHSAILSKIIDIEKDIKYYYYKGLHPDQYAENLKEWYRERTGEELNLENPTTFNEKVQWLKLNDSTELKTKLTDKYLVRKYVKEKIGEEYLIPLLGVYNSFDDIDFSVLPDKFAMKTNHSSGWNVIVTDKAGMDIKEAKRKFDLWMKRNYAYNSGLELHYKNIVPRIVVEEYIENGNDEIFDYRFFCFSGKAYAIWIDIDSGKPTHKRNIYDLDWNLQPLKVNYPNDYKLDKKPKNLKKMIELAEKLSEGIDMVRVDLYEINDKIYFGELTFTPQSGQASWEPAEYNRIYGEQIELPDIK